jgi:hypothetical protein
MKKLFFLFLLSFLSIWSWVFAQQQVSDSEDIKTRFLWDISNMGTTLIDLLVNEMPDQQERRSIILHYCDVMLWVNKGKNLAVATFGFDTMVYDPKKSLFMYALCTNMDKNPKGHQNYQQQFKVTKDFDMQTYLKESVKDMNTLWWIPKQENLDSETSYSDCNPKTSMMNCEFSSFAPEIFATLMNDMSNIKLSTIYWVKYGPKPDDRRRAIVDFSKVFFQDPEHPGRSCETDDENVFYLSEKPNADGSKQHCSHPKTYKYLDQMMASAHTLSQKTDWLKSKTFLENSCKNFQWDFYACAMSTSGAFASQNSQSAFQNMVLNEMMRYNLFLSYYKGVIKLYSNYKPLSFNGFGNSVEEDNYEQITLSNEQMLMQKSVWQMLRQMSSLYATFPLHIGLLAYYEDMLYVRKSMTTLYTPLHQLYYKLRNVQDCSQ